MTYDIAVIINARIQSTRVKNKLLRSFYNTTLLEIALDKLSKINNCNERYLAACDKEIISLYSKHSNEVSLLERKPESVVKGQISHLVAFEHFKKVKSTYIMILNPCHPFTTVDLYKNAIEYFFTNNLTSLTSVSEKNNIYFNDRFEAINLSNKKEVSTQNQKNIYEMAHVFHIFNKNNFIQNGILWNFTKGDPSCFVVNKKEALDIDDELDFLISELLYINEKTNIISSNV